MLLLDAGNTRCKWAHIENGEWTKLGVAINTEWQVLQGEFDLLSKPLQIVISNVGGETMAQNLRALCSKWAVPVKFVVAQSRQCGVSNSYENPARLGSDRWAALVAAWHRVGRACLVVNCGTATTVDALSDAGVFLGGLILPGVRLMQQSLAHTAALLPEAGGDVRDFPQSTENAIYSGVIRATLGAIAHQHTLLQQLAAASITCVLSGGAAGQIETLLGETVLGTNVERVDNLVLEGLKIIGETSA